MDQLELLENVKGLINNQANLTKQALDEIKTKGAVPSEITEKLLKMGADHEKFTNAYNELKAATEAQNQKQNETIGKLEAKIIDFERGGLAANDEAKKTLGERFTESNEFKEMMANHADISRKFAAGTLLGKDITSATAGDTLGVPTRLSGITGIPNVPLTVRELLPVGRTSNNSIEYVKENTFTNNAGPQFSPGVSPDVTYDGARKNKSDLTWTLMTANVRTIAHYMKASRQILDDAPMLQSEINNRLLYGLALEEEEQILLGNGSNGNMLGIVPQAADYDTALSVSGQQTKIDLIRHALLQVTRSKYLPTGIVLSPTDWHDIELIKTTLGNYILSNPANQTVPRLWGYRVVASLSMTTGRFLVGNFSTGAQIFDRMNATVEIARQNEDDLIRNMITILAEQRIALAVYTPNAFVDGAFL